MLILHDFYYLVSLFLMLVGLRSFINYRKHFLNLLLRLEFSILGIFFFISSVFSSIGTEIFFLLYFLTFAACEGALGLSLLVNIVNFYGNDYLNRFNLLRC